MEKVIRDYFKGFLTDIIIFNGDVQGHKAIGFEGYRNGNRYAFSTNQVQYEGDMLYHWLENVKGQIETGI